jgi:hypothetical protein
LVSAEKVPSGHGRGSDDPAGQYEAIGQPAVVFRPVPLQKKPDVHVVQVLAADKENVPAGQSAQELRPVELPNDPPGHGAGAAAETPQI